jgi:hypothetical protein
VELVRSMPRPGSVVGQGRYGEAHQIKTALTTGLRNAQGSRPRCQPVDCPSLVAFHAAPRSCQLAKPRCLAQTFPSRWMFGHVLETAARPAACWSAARPREATSTTTMLISPPPGLAPNGLSRLLRASRLAGEILNECSCSFESPSTEHNIVDLCTLGNAESQTRTSNNPLHTTIITATR